MRTEILQIDPKSIDIDKIKYSAQIIKNGGLVVIPTETVYGLAANAFDSNAIKKIFIAKGRPSDNPLIVHIAKKEQIDMIAKNVAKLSSVLMDKFWPGALTIVMEKTNIIPDIITAGLSTVAVRMPSHPVALSLIQEAKVPIAAPSANLSGKPSTTCAEHAIFDMNGRVDLIIDSGYCDIGLESTVIDMVSIPPVVLRPGGVTFEQLSQIIPKLKIDNKTDIEEKDIPKAPGMKYKHYSPEAQLIIVKGDPQSIAVKINDIIIIMKENNKKIGIMATDETFKKYNNSEVYVLSVGSRENKDSIAVNLFDVLRKFDQNKVEIILAESIDQNDIGFAIMNRMNKASGYNIIEV